MVGVHQILNGSCDLTTPLSWMICHPRARTSYYKPAYQIWSLYLRPLRRHEKKYKICKMGLFAVVTGHSKSLKIAPFDVAHTSSYYPSTVTICPYLAPFLRSRVLGRKSPFWTYLLLFGAPLGVTPLEFRRDLWPRQTRVPLLSYGVFAWS